MLDFKGIPREINSLPLDSIPVELFAPKDAEVLTSSTCECDFIGK